MNSQNVLPLSDPVGRAECFVYGYTPSPLGEGWGSYFIKNSGVLKE